MKFNSNTAREAGQRGKRGLSERTKILNELLKEENAREVFAQLETKAKNGDMEAIKLYLSYCFGKPKETIDIQSGEMPLNKLIVEVIANGGGFEHK